MKFDFIACNPPYAQETASSSPTNGQAPKKSIFQYFQTEADKIAREASVMIYPGGRWIQRSGKGMEAFGLSQINDKKLKDIYFYPNSSEIFPSVAIPDGISIVVKDTNKKENGFNYVYCNNGEEFTIALDNPGKDVLPLNPNDLSITMKIRAFVRLKNLHYLSERVRPRALFGIESNFVENNKSSVRPYTSDDAIDYTKEIKLYANDKAGKAGRTTLFVADRSIITSNQEYIDKWKVVVSSANAGGQKRDNQLEIFDNHSAFGRSRVAIASFDTHKEAQNFYDYVCSFVIRFAFLLTDEALTTLAMCVPDIGAYTEDNGFIDFSKSVDEQLCKLIGFTEDEYCYMKSVVENLR